MNFICQYEDESRIQNPEIFMTSINSRLSSVDIIKFVTHFQREFKASHPISYKIEELEVVTKRCDLIEEFQRMSFQQKRRNREGPQRIQFAMVLPINFPDWEMYVKVVMDFELGKINIVSTIMKNGSIIKALGHNIRQSFTRFLLILNSHLKWGSLTLNPVTKQIWQTKFSFYDRDQLRAAVKNPFVLVQQIKFEVMCTRRFWNISSQKILCLINQASLRLQHSPNNEFTEKIAMHVKQLVQIFKQSHLEYPFMFESHGLKAMSQVESKQKKKQCIFFLQQFPNKNKKFAPEITKMLTLFNRNFKDVEMERAAATQMLPASVTQQLANKLQTSNTPGRFPVYSNLDVSQIKEQTKKKIEKGGYSDIFVVDVIGKRIQDSKDGKIHLVVKKTDSGRIKAQKNIVSLFKNSQCLFVSRYFQSKHAQFEDSILMEYCCHRSLERYISQTQDILSLQTKLFFLVQIIIALRFLRDHNVTHLDVKPQNILAKIMSDRTKKNSTFLLRLIDFGQSYSINFPDKQRRGTTIPYSSPEMLQQKGRYNQKSDVFSFGVMALQMIFNVSIDELRKLTKSNYKQNYMSHFSFCPQKCRYFGFSELMIPMYGLFLKCLDTNQKNRPSLNWLCLSLKECLTVMQKIYK